MRTTSYQKISILALTLLITGAIDNVRNLPTVALFGPSLIIFFVFAAIVFLIPVALISAELSSTWSEEEGGVYSWVNLAFGETAAFFTIWLQWINTIVWYPTILSFIAGTLAYLINPELAQNKAYLIVVILIVFWSLTMLGLRGLRASSAFASFSTITGMILPMGLIIFLAFVWLISGNHLAIKFNLSSLMPSLQNTQSWVSLTAIMTSFLGMELAAVHVRNVANPQQTFPRAMLFSVILILITMIFGSLAIAFVLPHEEINLVAGTMQAFNNFFKAYNLTAFMPIIVVLLLIGSLGNMINWIISPAKGLLLAADNGFLPHWLYKKNRFGVASRILLLQAILVTILCSGFVLFPSINAIYWLFTDLSTELYIVMYIMMFIAAWHLKGKYSHISRAFVIPGGKTTYYLTCILGLIGCCITLIVGFFPPEMNMGKGGSHLFRLVFTCCLFIMILPAFLLYLRKKLTGP